MSTAALLGLLPSLVLPHQGARWPKPDPRVACGPLTLEVHVSRTAHLFHVVDQLSRWDNACHGQYREHMALSPEDEALLARYAEVRAKRRWGQGLEQTFYAPLELKEAAREGERAGQVTGEELEVILPVLEHFAPRVEELLAEKRPVLENAFARIDRERLTRAAEELARFTGVKKLCVPVFPLASPVPGGGGMDGGRLRWELASEDVSFSVLLHETTHGFFLQKEAELRAVVDATPGLTMTLLGEGFAYAMAPGIYPDGDDDNLAYNVAKDRANQETWEDQGYEWQRMYGLALRPLLREALREKTSLESFLPRARDVFLALREVWNATADRAGPPKLLIAGPGSGSVRERLLDSKYHLWIVQTSHEGPNYAESLPKLGPGDLFVLLIAGDDSQRIPAEYAWLSPLEPTEIERRIRSGKLIEESQVPQSTYRVVLLAAPTKKELEELVRKSRRLEE